MYGGGGGRGNGYSGQLGGRNGTRSTMGIGLTSPPPHQQSYGRGQRYGTQSPNVHFTSPPMHLIHLPRGTGGSGWALPPPVVDLGREVRFAIENPPKGRQRHQMERGMGMIGRPQCDADEDLRNQVSKLNINSDGANSNTRSQKYNTLPPEVPMPDFKIPCAEQPVHANAGLVSVNKSEQMCIVTIHPDEQSTSTHQTLGTPTSESVIQSHFQIPPLAVSVSEYESQDTLKHASTTWYQTNQQIVFLIDISAAEKCALSIGEDKRTMTFRCEHPVGYGFQIVLYGKVLQDPEIVCGPLIKIKLFKIFKESWPRLLYDEKSKFPWLGFAKDHIDASDEEDDFKTWQNNKSDRYMPVDYENMDTDSESDTDNQTSSFSEEAQRYQRNLDYEAFLKEPVDLKSCVPE